MLLEENGMDEKRNNCDTKEIETKESAGEKVYVWLWVMFYV